MITKNNLYRLLLSTCLFLLFSHSGLCQFEVTLTGQTELCEGECTDLVANASGGVEPYVYEWSDGSTGDIITFCAPGGPGTYNLELQVTDATNTTVLASIAINVLVCSNVEIDIEGPESLCVGECATYTANSIGSTVPCDYYWNTPDGIFDTESVEFCAPDEGTYTFALDVYDCNGNLYEYYYYITSSFVTELEIVSTSPAACPDNDPTSVCEKTCSNSTITYTVPGSQDLNLEWEVIGAESYEVDNNLVTVTWGNPGVGQINVASVDTTGSSGSLPLHVDCVTLAPEYTNGSLGSIAAYATGGTPPYTYTWTPGGSGNSPLLENLSAGLYTVQVNDAAGGVASCSSNIYEYFCSFGDGVALENNVAITHLLNEDCAQGNNIGAIDITVASGQAPFNFSWTDGSTTEDISGLSPGDYSVTVSDFAGCTVAAFFTIECMVEDQCISNPMYLNFYATSPSIDGAPTGTGAGEFFGGTPPYTIFYFDQFFNQINDLQNLAPGIYNVVVEDSYGCEELTTFEVLSYSIPSCFVAPYIEINQYPSDCSSSDGFLIADAGTTGSIDATYLWDNGETTFSLSDVTVGTYCVTITDISWGCEESTCITLECNQGDICPGEGSICVDIIAEPEAAFMTIPDDVNGVIEICMGETVSFQNTSLNAENYVWNLGDGFSTSTENVEHTYEQSGLYDVLLIARNECFCFDTTSVKVLVSDAIIPEIECVGTVCAGDSATYTTNADCSEFIWTISPNGVITAGGGLSDNFISVDWNSGPEGEVSLQVANCNGNYCSSPTIATIPIIVDGVPIEGPAQVCPGEITTYTIPKWGGTAYTWTASPLGEIKSGQGTNSINVKWNVETVVTEQQWVQVNYDNCFLECGGEAYLEIDITPDFYLAGPIEVCANSSSEYAALDELGQAPVNCNWTVLDPAGAVYWTSPGSNAVVDIDWPVSPGKYTLQAFAEMPEDYCTDIYSINVNVTEGPPVVNGIDGTNTICPGEYYTYEVISTLPNVQFFWVINNGGTLSENAGETINVQWGATPPYELSVTQVSTEGLACESLPLTMTIDAINDITLSGPNATCIENIESYTAPSIGNASYQWNVSPSNAGTILSGQGSEAIEILWHAEGIATINLSACGISESLQVDVLGYPNPVVVHPDSLCANETGLTTVSALYNSYSWRNEGGDVISSASSVDLGPGFYELQVTNSAGCPGSTTFRIEEAPTPLINISTPGLYFFCLDVGFPPATLYALDTEDGYSYEWYQDGTALGVFGDTYTPSGEGTFYVVVTASNGCTAQSNSIYLYESCPTGGGGGGFPGGGGCVGIDNEFTNGPTCDHGIFENTSTNYVPGTVQWNFDDPTSGADNSSTLENPEHYFTDAGFYGVQMTALNTNGSLCLLHKPFVVPARAEFDIINNCPGLPVQFEDISTITVGAVISNWAWDFGDPASGVNNTSSLQHPSHIYNNTGTYTVTLVITEQSGCTSTATSVVEVLPPPTASFQLPAASCEATAISFEMDPMPDITSFEWNFGDPASQEANISRLAITYHAFTGPGVYNVQLKVANVYGCTDSISMPVTITSNNLSGVIDMTPASPLCAGDSTVLTAPAGGTQWYWSTGSTIDNISAMEAGVYEVTIVDDFGCAYAPPPAVLDLIQEPDATIKVTEYNEFGQPMECFFNGYILCEGEDVFLSIDGADGYSYVWSNGQAGNEVIYDDEHGGTLEVGEHEFTVTVTDESTGCTSIEGPYSITVNPVPSDILIASAPSGPICEQTQAVFTVTNPNPDFTYLWSTGAYGTTITASTAGEYYVVAISTFGCEGQSNIIEIFSAPDVERVPDGCHTHCSPTPICLPDMPDVVAYQWYLNDVPVPAPEGTSATFTPEEAGSYTLELFDANGCHAISEPLDLELAPISSDSLQLGNCNGEVVEYAGEILMPGSVTDFVFENQYGCDSTVTVSVLADLSYEETFDFGACEGGSIIFEGMEYPAGSSDTLSFTGSTGCDSIIYINVNTLPVQNENLTLVACDGMPVEHDGELLDPGTMTEFNYTNQSGCDSTVLVTVLADQNYQATIDLSGCEGGVIVYEGESYPTGSTQTLQYQTTGGCDSIIILEIEALPVHDEVLPLFACPGETVEYENDDLPTGSSNFYNYQNQYGCDSIVNVVVSAWPSENETVTLFGCDGETVTFEGQQYPVGSQTILSYSNQYGCDSIINLNIEAQTAYITPVSLEACAGEQVEYNGMLLDAGSITEFDYTSVDGCDSVVVVEVLAYPDFNFELGATDIVCWNNEIGQVEILNLTGGSTPFSYSLNPDNYQIYSSWNNLPGGDYTVYVKDANGCVKESDVSIDEIPPLDIAFNAPHLACDEDSVLINSVLLQGFTDSITYLWQHGYEGNTAPAYDPGVYILAVTNECESTNFELEINVDDGYRDNYLYIPNAFSPNYDGVNDEFRAYAADGVTVLTYELRLFDRWGNTLYVSTDIEDGWDGRFLEEDMNPGVYVWWLKAEVLSCRNVIDIFEKGDITIIK